ncbi:MAG: histidinol-phosphate transaminase [Alkalispirochaetaceae bacterium]
MRYRAALDNMEPYVPGKKRAGAIKLSSNENPLGPSPKAVEAARKSLETLHFYPDGGATELRHAVAQRHRLTPEQIIIGNGSDEVLTLAAAAVIEPGDETVTAEHTFSQYAFATTLYGGSCRRAPMRDGRFDPEALLDKIGEQTKIVFLCNPNNPTGTYLSADTLDSFLKAVPADCLVIIDEAYADYAVAPDFPRSEKLLDRFDNILVLRTFSKIYGIAGLRVGYGFAREELIERLGRARQPFNANSPGQAAAVAALSDEEHRAASLELNRASLAFMEGALGTRGLPYFETQANFLCVDLGRDAEPIYRKLADGGITVRALHSFGLPTMLRITLGPVEIMEQLISLLDAALTPERAASSR